MPEASSTPVSAEPVHDLSYASAAPPKNLAAMFSFIFGMVSFIPWIPPALAVWLGRRGIRNAEHAGRRRLAKAGLVLGLIGLAWSLPATAMGVLAWQRAVENARRVTSASNLRQIALAQIMYMNDNGGYLPSDANQLVVNGYIAPVAFVCPARMHQGLPPVSNEPFGRCDYVLLTPAEVGVDRISKIRRPSSTIMGYAPPANFGGAGATFLFVDGHIEWHDGQRLQTTLSTLPPNPATRPAAP